MTCLQPQVLPQTLLGLWGWGGGSWLGAERLPRELMFVSPKEAAGPLPVR